MATASASPDPELLHLRGLLLVLRFGQLVADHHPPPLAQLQPDAHVQHGEDDERDDEDDGQAEEVDGLEDGVAVAVGDGAVVALDAGEGGVATGDAVQHEGGGCHQHRRHHRHHAQHLHRQ